MHGLVGLGLGRVPSAPARPPTSAVSRSAPWRCSRTPAATRGPSSSPSSASATSCATSRPLPANRRGVRHARQLRSRRHARPGPRLIAFIRLFVSPPAMVTPSQAGFLMASSRAPPPGRGSETRSDQPVPRRARPLRLCGCSPLLGLPPPDRVDHRRPPRSVAGVLTTQRSKKATRSSADLM
jgi:hypothetical protein